MRSLILVSALIASIWVNAQCTGCLIDQNCVSSPAYPTLCPPAMPDATVGVYYEEDMTFWLPANFDDPDTGFNVDFDQMTITNVQGLPFGMNYEPDQINGTYFPQNYEYGCARICGTALSPGAYSITISVMVDVAFNGINISLPQQFVLPLNVLPGTGGNSGFTFTPSSGCDTVCTTLSAQIDGSPLQTTYTWTIGTDTLTGQQVNYCFTDSGQNSIGLLTEVHENIITDVYIDGVNDNWCGDVEEPYIFGCTLAPDLYFVVTNGSGNTVFTSSAGTDSEDEEWHNLSIALNDPPYSIQFWDEDLISGDDPLGTFNLPLAGAGTYPYNVAGGTNGSIVVGSQLFQSFSDHDSVLVFQTPDLQLLYDSMAGTLAMPLPNGLFTWFHDGDTIPFETDSLIPLNTDGQYWVNATSQFGCELLSDTFLLCPTVVLNIDTAIGLLSVSGSFESYQWYSGAGAISGATDPFLIISAPGTYYVVVTTELGCVVTSNSFLDATGIGDMNNSAVRISVYPSPGDGRLTLTLPVDLNETAHVEVFATNGIQVLVRSLMMRSGSGYLDLTDLARGVYVLRVRAGDRAFTSRFVRE